MKRFTFFTLFLLGLNVLTSCTNNHKPSANKTNFVYGYENRLDSGNYEPSIFFSFNLGMEESQTIHHASKKTVKDTWRYIGNRKDSGISSKWSLFY